MLFVWNRIFLLGLPLDNSCLKLNGLSQELSAISLLFRGFHQANALLNIPKALITAIEYPQ